MTGRFSLAVERGHVSLPDGPVLVVGAAADSDLGILDRTTARVLTRYRDAHDALSAAGWTCDLALDGPFAAALVFAPRARAAQRAALAMARNRTAGPIVVDGAKTDGIDALYREVKVRAEVSDAYAKAHGKVFAVTGGDFSDWPEFSPAEGADGWWRAPGVFAEGGIDTASALLAEALPDALPGRVVDLGAGWGYLASAVLARRGVAHLDLVENDHAALAAARRNIGGDARAAFHWADARCWRPDAPADLVVTNPPFHAGRKGVPELGQAFIRAAAEMLGPKGQLWLVANRHLPYESTLEACFRELREVGGTPAFKVLAAERPRPR
ncbi:MAG: class I SAM-dependent methyltransferase [Paracoccaceae bacterium]|nr:class I SAM-dependent methyltransferase [Paracoccaceae bacterium]